MSFFSILLQVKNMDHYTKRELFTIPEKSAMRPVYGRENDGLARTVDRLLAIGDDERLIITADIMGNRRTTNYNKKHSWVIDIADAAGVTPTQKARNAYGVSERFRVSGYGWQRHGTQMVVPLVKVLDGARLFAYEVSQPGWEDDVKIYDAAAYAKSQGIRATVKVSSRREKEPRHLVRWRGVPIMGENWQQANTASVDCEDGLFRDLAFKIPEERSTFCAHEAAAYFMVAQYLADEGNAVPARLSPFAYPGQGLIDLYRRLERQVQVERTTPAGRKVKRDINELEAETLLTTAVATQRVNGFDASGKLAERVWR